jgi:hypothetical protein
MSSKDYIILAFDCERSGGMRGGTQATTNLGKKCHKVIMNIE